MTTKLQRPVTYGPKGEPLYSASQLKMAFELGRRAMVEELEKGKKDE